MSQPMDSRIAEKTDTARRPWLRFLFIMVFISSVGRAAEASGSVRFSRTDGELVLSSRACRVAWSETDGAFRGLELLRGPQPPARLLNGGGTVWRVRFADGAEVDDSKFRVAPWTGQFSFEWNRKDRRLSLIYSSAPNLILAVDVEAAPDSFGLRARVVKTAKPILRFDLPARFLFDPKAVRGVVFPQSGGLSPGIAFRPPFFGSHANSATLRWGRRRVGPGGYELLFGAPLKQLADEPPLVPLKVTETGHAWFTPVQARVIESHRMIINRPPAPGQAPLVLVTSSNGPVLCGNPLGGKGLLLRFTGRGNRTAEGADRRCVEAMVLGASAALARQFPDRFRGRRVGLIDLDNGPEQGGWAPVPVSEWRRRLAATGFIRTSGAKFERLTTPEAVRSGLESDQVSMILNPYGEYLPSQNEGDWRKTLELVRDFVHGGGFWWELGGYPFFYEFVEERTWYSSETAQYPAATADFIHLQLRSGALAVYGEQPLLPDPWGMRDKPDRLLTPAELGVGGAVEGGYFHHGWHTALEPGHSWRSPLLRFSPGPSVEKALSRYGAILGLNRKLAEKMPGDKLAVLKHAVLVRLGGGTAKEQTAALDLLPPGSLVHFTEYLHGGFDKQYPDHLPPRPSWGTAADLEQFYARGHELGHLMMPYTNTSWWCTGPKGPTFEREGEAPLARTRDGRVIKERYAFNEGRRICFWHPAVRAADQRVCREMTETYPSDVLFQDQVGARGWSYDYNPVAPSPTAWISGLLSMGIEDARHVPLATEDGYDRVAQFETLLCGMAWGIVPSGGRQESRRNIHRFSDGDWEPFPILEYLAHDKAIFTLHDLGHFVLSPEQLAWTVGLGFAMSYRCSGSSLEAPVNRRWLFWLDAVQKTVCAAYAGQSLEAFQALRAPGDTHRTPAILLTRYAGDVRVAANTGTVSLPVSGLPAAWQVAGIAPTGAAAELVGPGFLAAGPDFRAGFVRTPRELPVGYAVRRVGPGRFEATFLAPEDTEIAVPIPATGPLSTAPAKAVVTERFPERGHNAGSSVRVATTISGSTRMQLRLPRHAAGRNWAVIPPELQGKAPMAWPGRSRTIAVIACQPPAPRSWVQVNPEEWVKTLHSAGPALENAGFRTTILRSAAALHTALIGPVETRPFAILNPNGEYFVAESLDAWAAQLDAIRKYVRNGGIWWEVGGYSFYNCAAPKIENGRIAGWATRTVGPAGAARLGFTCAGYEVDAPAEPLVVTPAGRVCFGPERSARLEALASGVQRSFLGHKEDVVLVRGRQDDFVAAVRLGGWGWLWRLGGFNPEPAAAREAVVGVLEYLATHPWSAPHRQADLRLWSATLELAR